MRSGERPTVFTTVVSSLNAAGSAWIVVLMLLVCADVAARALLNFPIRGVAEIVALSLAACVFLQLPHVLETGRLTRVELFIDPLTARRPRRGHALDGVHHLIGAAITALVFGSSVPRFVDVWRSGDYVGTQNHFTAPLWPVQLAILIGSGFTTIEFLRFAWRHFRAAWTGGRPPAPAEPVPVEPAA